MTTQIEIEKAIVGPEQPVFIIAEGGVNHNGDAGLAERLILAAKEAGADCIKFQTFKAERVVTADAPKAKYQLGTTDPQESQLAMLRKLELDFSLYESLVALCRKHKIVFMSTPYNTEDVDFLDEIDIPAFKLASIHLAEPSFLQYVAGKGKPMIISTGMATLAEVDEAVRAVRATGNEQFVLLQCTTNYPSKLEDANLRAMQTMADAFDVLVGYSDHTQTDTACITSVALGACVIEKHFTLDKTLPGPDQSTSADPTEFRCLVKNIREAETVLGSGIKEPTQVEKENMIGMRRSIVAQKPIAAGQVLAPDMLIFKRPANGIRPSFFNEIIGRKALEDIPAGQMLTWKMIGD
ncbi:MAG: N-acetylneuraminate synthase [Candidatus Promineifilaceae bacterium]